MRKRYSTPTIEVIMLQQQGIICTSNTVSRVNSNAGINFNGGGTGPARVRYHNPVEWDDWEQ